MCIVYYLKNNLKMLQDTNVCMCEIKLSFAGDARLYHTRQHQQCMYTLLIYVPMYCISGMLMLDKFLLIIMMSLEIVI